MWNEKKRPAFKKLPLFVAMLGCLYGTVAIAQDAPVDEETTTTKKDDAVELDKVTVTGSLLRRVEYDSTSPVQVITADTSVNVGQIDTASFLQQSSVAAGSTQITNQFSGFVIEGGTGVQSLSLRGLGAQRTLVLLNGNRPGPAGTRGQVGAFDLNVIPSSILQRAEILKDGASSIYGSDAVGGVVNLITRKTVDKPEISVTVEAPFRDGGERYTVSGATGWNFDNGSIVVAGEYFLQNSLKRGDRDYLACSEDFITNQQGERIDREDRSILAGTALAGCNNLYANTVIDAFTGVRYVPSPDGSTVGLIPGYRPRTSTTYANGGQASYQDVLNFDFVGQADIVNRQERKSVYAASDFTFGSVNWTTEWLYNKRTTEARGLRQFFPFVGGPGEYTDNPAYAAATPSGYAIPVLPMRSDSNIEVDYYYVNSGLDGYLPFGDWTWKVNTSYSRSEGKYSGLGIVASRTGDLDYTTIAPTIDYFDPGFLSGRRMDELSNAIAEWNTGTTIYEQFVVNGVATGELFELPAGTVGAAVGVEYRDFRMDDQPSNLSRNGDLWGQSSAQVTKGQDKVKEVFGEVEVPLLKGIPGIESLTFNASGRVFDYQSVADRDNVWKIGLGWQVIPSLRLRATKGTSYRAPGLYELYLGNQSGFASQQAIDPCILWGESSNDFVRANCAAAGIPADYAGAAASATVFQGGGAGFLKPETSKAFTAGLIFTPSFAPISVALDYFEFQLNDQIDTLDAGSILGGCYGAPVYPNNFCNLFTRTPGTNPDPTRQYGIEEVRATYINVNKQQTKGWDLLARYDNDLSFGNLEVEGQFTYTFKDEEQLFDSAIASGYATNDRNGAIGRPKLVGNLRTALRQGDFTYSWFMNYVGGTKALFVSPVFTYFGQPNAVRDINAESRLYHTVSVRYQQADWSFLLGVRNLFDAAPPNISTGAGTRYGNIPAFATQYDIYGRTLFARVNYRF